MNDLSNLAYLSTIFDDLARMERAVERALVVPPYTTHTQSYVEGYKAAMSDVRKKLLEYYGRKA